MLHCKFHCSVLCHSAARHRLRNTAAVAALQLAQSVARSGASCSWPGRHTRLPCRSLCRFTGRGSNIVWEELVKVHAVQHNEEPARYRVDQACEAASPSDRVRRAQLTAYAHCKPTARTAACNRQSMITWLPSAGPTAALLQHGVRPGGAAPQPPSPRRASPLVLADIIGEAQLGALDEWVVIVKHQQLAVHPLGVGEALEQGGGREGRWGEGWWG